MDDTIEVKVAPNRNAIGRARGLRWVLEARQVPAATSSTKAPAASYSESFRSRAKAGRKAARIIAIGLVPCGLAEQYRRDEGRRAAAAAESARFAKANRRRPVRTVVPRITLRAGAGLGLSR